jgi:hypothetical protein
MYRLIIHVAGGWQLRTKARYADAIRARGKDARDAGPPELTPNERFVVTAIAYLADLSRLAGREISRDVVGRLKHLGLIDAAMRAPEVGAPTPMSRRGSFWRRSDWRACANCLISNDWRMQVSCNDRRRKPARSTTSCRRMTVTTHLLTNLWNKFEILGKRGIKNLAS